MSICKLVYNRRYLPLTVHRVQYLITSIFISVHFIGIFSLFLEGEGIYAVSI